MSFITEKAKEMKEESVVKDEIKNAIAPHQQPVQANGVALPIETFNKIIVILRKMSYDTVGDLMDEIKKELVGANIVK